MSNPRASIRRAVTAPPTTALVPSIGVAVAGASIEGRAATPRPIGKQHGRMRSVNLSLSVQAARLLRQRTTELDSTLGEVLIDLVRTATIDPAPRADGRRPAVRRNQATVNVYVLLTPKEADELQDSARRSGRSTSDFASHVLAGPS